DPRHHRRRPLHRGQRALSRAPSHGAPRPHRSRLGPHREQAPREVLHAEDQGTPATARPRLAVGPLRECGGQGDSRDDATVVGGARMSSETRKWHRYLRFWRTNIAADVDEEIAFHVDARAQELIDAGASPADAKRRALQEFGDVERARVTLRSMDERHFAYS